MVPVWQEEQGRLIRSDANRTVKGELGSLNNIFKDLQLAFDAVEFKSMLYTVMASDKYKLEDGFFPAVRGPG